MSSKTHGAHKFIERNRPPRVQIGIDEEVNGARLKVSLPFVAGVIADLSGKWAEPEEVPKGHVSARGELADRKFLDISQDNFSERMKAFRPTVSFTVPNTLTGQGHLPVTLTFESMDDFSPDKIAEQIEPLRQLFEARRALAYLKNKATNSSDLEKLLQKLLSKPELAQALVAASKLPEN